jgi:hypothetical protein
MDALTFCAEMTKALAWPVASVTIAWIFRAQIQVLLTRLKKGKLGPAEFEFEQGVLQAQLDIPQNALPAATRGAESLEQNRQSFEPRAAVLDAWLKVESALYAFASARGVIPEPAAKNAATLATNLVRDGLLDPWLLNLIRDLRRLRNQATHDSDFAPSAQAVLSYVQMADELELELRKLAHAS